MGENYLAPIPTALYGVSLLTAALAWLAMQMVIYRAQGPDSPLRRALGRDLKGKISAFLYLTGIGMAFVNPAAADLVYAGVALIWLIPDRRVEASLRA